MLTSGRSESGLQERFFGGGPKMDPELMDLEVKKLTQNGAKILSKTNSESTLDRATKTLTMTCNSTCFQHPPIFKKHEKLVFQWFLHVAPSGENSSHELRHPQQIIKIDLPNGAKATTKLIQNVVSKMDRKNQRNVTRKGPPNGGHFTTHRLPKPPQRPP